MRWMRLMEQSSLRMTGLHLAVRSLLTPSVLTGAFDSSLSLAMRPDSCKRDCPTGAVDHATLAGLPKMSISTLQQLCPDTPMWWSWPTWQIVCDGAMLCQSLGRWPTNGKCFPLNRPGPNHRPSRRQSLSGQRQDAGGCDREMHPQWGRWAVFQIQPLALAQSEVLVTGCAHAGISRAGRGRVKTRRA